MTATTEHLPGEHGHTSHDGTILDIHKTAGYVRRQVITIDGIEMDMLDGGYHRTDASVGLFSFFKQEHVFASELGAPIVKDTDGGEQDGHMTIVAATLCEACTF